MMMMSATARRTLRGRVYASFEHIHVDDRALAYVSPRLLPPVGFDGDLPVNVISQQQEGVGDPDSKSQSKADAANNKSSKTKAQ